MDRQYEVKEIINDNPTRLEHFNKELEGMIIVYDATKKEHFIKVDETIMIPIEYFTNSDF